MLRQRSQDAPAATNKPSGSAQGQIRLGSIRTAKNRPEFYQRQLRLQLLCFLYPVIVINGAYEGELMILRQAVERGKNTCITACVQGPGQNWGGDKDPHILILSLIREWGTL
jgi:hypothetical protein